MIVAPDGNVVRDHCSGQACWALRSIFKEIIRCKVDLDIVGHYSRRDIFDLRLIVP